MWRPAAVLLLLAGSMYPSIQQDTTAKSSCTFYDDKYTYNIELVKGPSVQNCESADTLNEKYKVTDKRTLETSHEVMKLQGLVSSLIVQNQQLQNRITHLEHKVQSKAFEDCPAGYTIKNEEFKSCYMFVGRGLNWYDAEVFCMSTNGHLVAFESEGEQEFIVKHIKADRILPGHHMWTGGNDIAKENQWMWAGINTEFNYTRWLDYPHPDRGSIQMPDNYMEKEHCVHLFHLHNYDWNDMYCGFYYYFICEAKLI